MSPVTPSPIIGLPGLATDVPADQPDSAAPADQPAATSADSRAPDAQLVGQLISAVDAMLCGLVDVGDLPADFEREARGVAADLCRVASYLLAPQTEERASWRIAVESLVQALVNAPRLGLVAADRASLRAVDVALVQVLELRDQLAVALEETEPPRPVAAAAVTTPGEPGAKSAPPAAAEAATLAAAHAAAHAPPAAPAGGEQVSTPEQAVQAAQPGQAARPAQAAQLPKRRRPWWRT